jgi:hypothetical protein
VVVTGIYSFSVCFKRMSIYLSKYVCCEMLSLAAVCCFSSSSSSKNGWQKRGGILEYHDGMVDGFPHFLYHLLGIRRTFSTLCFMSATTLPIVNSYILHTCVILYYNGASTFLMQYESSFESFFSVHVFVFE